VDSADPRRLPGDALLVAEEDEVDLRLETAPALEGVALDDADLSHERLRHREYGQLRRATGTHRRRV
jgi:hypothetical protein